MMPEQGESALGGDAWFELPAASLESSFLFGPSPSQKRAAMLELSTEIEGDLLKTKAKLDEFKDRTGFLGGVVDGLKAHLGGSKDGNLLSRSWSNLLDNSMVSTVMADEVERSLKIVEELKELSIAADQETFAVRLGLLTQGQPGLTSLRATSLVKAYTESQKAGVELLTDVGAGILASIATRRPGPSLPVTYLNGLLTGAMTKVSLKYADGQFADRDKDLSLGMAIGFSAPLGNYVGGMLSRNVANRLGLATVGDDLFGLRIKTMGEGAFIKGLSPLLKTGSAGGTFGLFEGPAREFWRQSENGESLSFEKLGSATTSAIGYGIVGGWAFGRLGDSVFDSFGRTALRTQTFLAESKPFEPSRVALKVTELSATLPVFKPLPVKSALPEYAKPKVENPFSVEAAFSGLADSEHKARMISYVERIFDKFKPGGFQASHLKQLVDQFPPHERPLAVAAIEMSALNSSDVGLRIQMKSIHGQLLDFLGLAAEGGRAAPNGTFVTLSPSSSANFLTYYYRKSSSFGSIPVTTLDEVGSHYGNGLIIFDDLSTNMLSERQRQILAKIPKVAVVDLHGFERGLNVLDFALGPEAVASKLKSLVASARQVQLNNPGLLPAAAMAEALDSPAEQMAKFIGPNLKVFRPRGDLKLPGLPDEATMAKLDPIDAAYAKIMVPKASKEQIARFLAGYDEKQQELAAQMLLEGAVNNSFSAMVAKSKALHREVIWGLEQSGKGVDNLTLVPDKDPGGSGHLISYVYGRANNLDRSNFRSNSAVMNDLSQDRFGDRVLAIFDDTIYSGDQMTTNLYSLAPHLSKLDQVVVGTLGAYEQGIQSLKQTHLGVKGKLLFSTAERHHRFLTEKNPLFARQNQEGRAIIEEIAGYKGYGNTQGSIIWPYMYPDNNLFFFGSKFSRGVLNLPGPNH